MKILLGNRRGKFGDGTLPLPDFENSTPLRRY